VRPEIRSRVFKNQNYQKNYHDERAKERNFSVGDQVFVKNFYSGPKWLSGEVTAKNGPVSYAVLGTDGTIKRRHVDHIRQRHCIPPDLKVEIPDKIHDSVVPAQPSSQLPTSVTNTNSSQTPITIPCSDVVAPKANTPQRPRRESKPPGYLKDYVV